VQPFTLLKNTSTHSNEYASIQTTRFNRCCLPDIKFILLELLNKIPNQPTAAKF
jgi:hypothetical protein